MSETRRMNERFQHDQQSVLVADVDLGGREEKV